MSLAGSLPAVPRKPRRDEPATDWNRRLFNAPEIVSVYTGDLGLTPCEAILFDRYLRPDTDILDLGVGGGRTTPSLMALARRYVGVDYAEAMIDVCRERFPDAEFHVADAAKLDGFEDDSFDAVVFSFNGIDCLYPDADRDACLSACARLLRPGGIFILSRHHPGGFVTFADVAGLSWWRAARRQVKASLLSLLRLVRAARGPLWKGEGYVLDPEHGGLLIHTAKPRCVGRELAEHGFEHLETLPSTFPRRRPGVMVPWYYYAFRLSAGR
jgi:SAM-dependent methyltransferase